MKRTTTFKRLPGEHLNVHVTSLWMEHSVDGVTPGDDADANTGTNRRVTTGFTAVSPQALQLAPERAVLQQRRSVDVRVESQRHVINRLQPRRRSPRLRPRFILWTTSCAAREWTLVPVLE